MFIIVHCRANHQPNSTAYNRCITTKQCCKGSKQTVKYVHRHDPTTRYWTSEILIWYISESHTWGVHKSRPEDRNRHVAKTSYSCQTIKSASKQTGQVPQINTHCMSINYQFVIKALCPHKMKTPYPFEIKTLIFHFAPSLQIQHLYCQKQETTRSQRTIS